MHRYQYTRQGFTIIPFGFRGLEPSPFKAAAHIARTGQLVRETFAFPEQEFETEAQARAYAEERANAVIDSGVLDAPSKPLND
jgi:hypothetical protein